MTRQQWPIVFSTGSKSAHDIYSNFFFFFIHHLLHNTPAKGMVTISLWRIRCLSPTTRFSQMRICGRSLMKVLMKKVRVSHRTLFQRLNSTSTYQEALQRESFKSDRKATRLLRFSLLVKTRGSLNLSVASFHYNILLPPKHSLRQHESKDEFFFSS